MSSTASNQSLPELIFWIVLAVVALERLYELRLSKRNTTRLKARGAFEVGAEHYPWMVFMHSSFLVCTLLEVLIVRPVVSLWVCGAATAALSVSMAIRYWAVTTLGERWTTRVLCLPGEAVITGGPYRFVRHPNYVAVVIEMAALPLVGGAWRTAVLFSLLNAAMLFVRIRAEERGLREHTNYSQTFGSASRP